MLIWQLAQGHMTNIDLERATKEFGQRFSVIEFPDPINIMLKCISVQVHFQFFFVCFEKIDHALFSCDVLPETHIKGSQDC